MPNLSSLDTIVAIVIVLLVLSLIVQSIQSIIKKFLKLKSRFVFDSMKDLFTYIDAQTLVGRTPKELVDEVTEEFKQLGRVSLISKRPMLDSIAKGDLQKILEKLHGDKLTLQVENWFDTVMQSFDERYTRHMKSVALVVSFVVVIVLNTNFFSIYRNIAESDVKRAALLQQGEALLERLKEQENATSRSEVPANQTHVPSPTPAPVSSVNRAATISTGSPAVPGNAPANVASSPTPSDAVRTNQQIKEDIKRNAQELEQYANDYKGLGFTPLKPRQVSNFILGHGPWEGIPFPDRFMHGGKVLLGWTIMALLLSVGAPFWQDTLESLFGLKNLIRQKSSTKNVEEEKGGQPKP